MTHLQAIEMLRSRTDRSFDFVVDSDGPAPAPDLTEWGFPDVDCWPEWYAAFASVSGILHCCETQRDLDNAIRRTAQLIQRGILSADDLTAKFHEIITPNPEIN